MADKQQAVHDQISERFLTCSICLERYKNARILPCHHSFCVECLTKYVGTQKVFKCPLCKQSCNTPKDGVSSLPASTHVNGIIEILDTHVTVPSVEVSADGTATTEIDKTCQICEDVPKSYRCIDCAVNICSVCSVSHSKFPATRGHNVMTCDEYETAKASGHFLVAPRVHCPTHSDQQLTHFCDSCQLPICVTCQSKTHSNHGIFMLSDYIKQLAERQEKIDEKEIEAQHFCMSLPSTYEKVEKEVRDNATTAISNFTAKVREQENKLVKTLKINQDEVIRQVEEQIQDCREKSKNLKSRRAVLEQLTCCSDQSRDQDDSHAVPTKPKEVKSEYKVPAKYQSSPIRIISYNPGTFVTQGSLGSLQDNSPCLNVRNNRTILPSELGIEEMVSKPIRVGEEIDVVIQHQECVEKAPFFLQNMKAQLKDQNDTVTSLTREVSKDLTLKFKCNKAGTHEFSMTLNDMHVHRSPYIFDVFPEWQLKQSFHYSSDTFKCPVGLAVDTAGNVTVADSGQGSGNGSILFLKGNDKVRDVENLQVFGFSKSFDPIDVAISESGRCFIADKGNNQIVVCNKGVNESFGQEELNGPKGIAVNEAKNALYVLDNSESIKLYNAQSPFELQKSIEFNGGECISVTSEGSVVVAPSSWTRLLQLIQLNGTVTKLYLDNNGKATGIAVDKYDDIYLCQKNDILKYSIKGMHSIKLVCQILQRNVKFQPYGIAVSHDTVPKIWVTDKENKCVHLIT
ncbi:uncharacterized protein LOC144450210 [Glandiceps talaboti]